METAACPAMRPVPNRCLGGSRELKLTAEESITYRSYGLLAGFSIVLVGRSSVAFVDPGPPQRQLLLLFLIPCLLSAAYLIVKDKMAMILGLILVSWINGPTLVAIGFAQEVGGLRNAIQLAILLSLMGGGLTMIWCMGIDMVARMVKLEIEAGIELNDVRRGLLATVLMWSLVFYGPLIVNRAFPIPEGEAASFGPIYWSLLALVAIVAGLLGATVSGTKFPIVVMLGALTAVLFSFGDTELRSSMVPAVIIVGAMMLGVIGVSGATALERLYRQWR